jgi:hypothetical protein
MKLWTNERKKIKVWEKVIACFQSQSYVTTDRQSVSLSWNKAPIWGLKPYLYYCLTVAGLLMWGVLSDERTGLSFANLFSFHYT